MKELKELYKSQDYSTLIAEVRRKIRKKPEVLEKGFIKEWCGRRFRNIFITEAVKDETALAAAEKRKLIGKDTRPDRQKIAERFLRGDGPNEWDLEMPDAELPPLQDTLLFCPGLLTGLLPVMAFQEAFPAIESKFNVRVLQSDSHPMRGCDANTNDVLNAIEKGIGLDANSAIISAESAKPPANVIVLTYSKGTPDFLTTLMKKPGLKKRVKAIFNWAGAPGGSPLANNIYKSVKNVKLEVSEGLESVLKLVSPVINISEKVRRLSEYNIIEAVRDLTTPVREEFMEDYSEKINDLGIPIFNLTGSTTVMEVPYFQMQGVLELNKYDANNDMQVTQKGAKIRVPIATDLAMLHGHHWDLSYGAFPERMRLGSPHLDHPFPKEAAATAILKFAFEIGLAE